MYIRILYYKGFEVFMVNIILEWIFFARKEGVLAIGCIILIQPIGLQIVRF